jgi:preprotein translocase subunit SecG
VRVYSGAAMPTLGTDPSEVAAGSLLRVRMAASTLQKLVAVAIVPMVAVTLWLALTSEHLEKPEAAGV